MHVSEIHIQPQHPIGYIAWVYDVRVHQKVLIEVIEAPTWGVLQDMIRVSGFHHAPEKWIPRNFDRQAVKHFLDQRAHQAVAKTLPPKNSYYGCIK